MIVHLPPRRKYQRLKSYALELVDIINKSGAARAVAVKGSPRLIKIYQLVSEPICDTCGNNMEAK
jgi:hypothetical protein